MWAAAYVPRFFPRLHIKAAWEKSKNGAGILCAANQYAFHRYSNKHVYKSNQLISLSSGLLIKRCASNYMMATFERR